MLEFVSVNSVLFGILAAYGTYVVATVSPGPANLAIMTTAMRSGRRAGLLLASGVVLGSLTWGVLAAAGMSALLATYADVTTYVRFLGGVFLLWLAFKAFRSTLKPVTTDQNVGQRLTRGSGWRFFATGLGIHLTNPKAVLAWMAIISIGVTPESSAWVSFIIVGGCWVMGILIFEGYALLFSTRRMVDAYGRGRLWIEAGAGGAFGFAGIGLIVSSR
ncbi:MAG: LysE family translocator [Alphaproteobacteria bacterium]|nr:LysE family translocator [Alphaproteobacteria bacterium]